MASGSPTGSPPGPHIAGSDPRPDIGYVLAGGASARMGTDKAFVELEGRPLVTRVVRAVHDAGIRRCVVVGGDAPRLEQLGLDVLADRWPGAGPLGAVVTALDHAAACDPRSAVPILACDLVEPDPGVVAQVLAEAAATGAHVTVPVLDGVDQWLHAVWHPASRGELAAAFAAGERSLRGVAPRLRVHRLHDVAPAALADADTPDELAGVEVARAWPESSPAPGTGRSRPRA